MPSRPEVECGMRASGRWHRGGAGGYPAAMSKLRETDLYAPVKALLEAQGYEEKGEVATSSPSRPMISATPVFKVFAWRLVR